MSHRKLHIIVINMTMTIWLRNYLLLILQLYMLFSSLHCHHEERNKQHLIYFFKN